MEPKKVTMFQAGLDQDYLELIARFLMVNSQAKGVYVSANRSAKDLTEKMRNYNFDLEPKLKSGQIYIVDLISRSVGAQEVDGAVYVASPSELSATQMAIEGVVNKFKLDSADTWVFVDSVPTLLIFNGAGALLNFLHFLIGRLRVLGYSGIILAAEGSLTNRVFSTVAQLCDRVIKL